jgi:hypothetical protein
MLQKSLSWRNALIGLAALTLLVAGAAVIIYVSVARDRLMPTPTPTPTATRAPTWTPVQSASDTPLPLVSVIGIVQAYSPGALIIVIAPSEGTIEQIIVPDQVVVMWGQERASSPLEIAPGQTIYAEGQLDALGRLIAERITIVRAAAPTPTQGKTLTPTASATPGTPTPTPVLSPTPGQIWRGEFYSNDSLASAPVLVRDDPQIDFHWQLGSPAPGVPADGFSVRWRGSWPFEQGAYRFYLYSDDGVRLRIDGDQVINQWRDQTATLVYTDLNLTAGVHELQVDYFDRVDNAQIRVWWEYRQFYPDWEGDYYTNASLTGTPALTRNDASIDYAWGDGAPARGLTTDNFSVRWTRTLILPQGPYRFAASVDDGVRVWVNERPVIDEWHPGALTTYTGHIWLDTGAHAVRVEYFDATGGAEAHLTWEKIETYRGWKGEYFANTDLDGKPAFVRDDETVAFDWQLYAPAPGLPSDNFSVRWSRSAYFLPGAYVFWTIVDDGVRLYVDGDLYIDEWHDSAAEWREAEVKLEGGEHTIVLEYYEHADKAQAQLNWGLLPTPTPSPSETLTPTLTPVGPTLTPSLTATPEPTSTV